VGSIIANVTSKSIGWDLFVRIVVLEDTSHSLESLVVLIVDELSRAVYSSIMETTWCAWISIGQGVVDRNTETDFTTSEHILEEGNLFGDLKLNEFKVTLLGLDSFLATLQFTERGITRGQKFMVTSRTILEHINLDLLTFIVVAKHICVNLHRRPILVISYWVLDLRLVDRLVLAWTKLLPDDDEGLA